MHDAAEFTETLWAYYAKHGRDLPWRQTADPYKIMVSELMLQQTQVPRVIPKYQKFLSTFPTIHALADAPLSQVLGVWSGLGYNRRAKYIHQAAQVIARDWHGVIPPDVNQLQQLPGIGHNTAAAIVVYAFNQPEYFIETNVRTAYIHHFFADADDVADKDIMPLLKQTLDTEQPREFYWALMDYGSHIKATVGNRARASRHYQKQSPFEGSLRQVRGRIIKALIDAPQTTNQLKQTIPDPRIVAVLEAFITEGHRARQRHLPLSGRNGS